MPVLRYIVVHKLFKAQNSDQIDEKFANELIENSEAANTFVTNFRQAHNIRAGILHGRFIEDQTVYPVQRYIRDYAQDKTPQKFLEMSVSIGKHLRSCLRSDKRSAGGYFIVFDYNDEPKGPIVGIALMNDKVNSGIDADTLKFTQAMTLDLNHMHVGTTVMIERLLSQEIGINYLTFMSGLRTVSELYKKDFIGCDNALLSAKATKSAMEAFEGFLIEEKHFDDYAMKEFRGKITKYFDDNPQEVSFQEMQNIAIPDPNDQEEFNNYIEEQDLEVSASFKPNKNSYKSWKKLYFKGSGIIVDIEPDRVKDRTVRYNDTEQEFIIKDPTGELGREFKKFEDNDELEEVNV